MNKIRAIDYILKKLENTHRQHIMDLVEGFADLRQKGKINKKHRGYATAISRAVQKLEANGKIKVVDYWEIERL